MKLLSEEISRKRKKYKKLKRTLDRMYRSLEDEDKIKFQIYYQEFLKRLHGMPPFSTVENPPDVDGSDDLDLEEV